MKRRIVSYLWNFFQTRSSLDRAQLAARSPLNAQLLASPPSDNKYALRFRGMLGVQPNRRKDICSLGISVLSKSVLVLDRIIGDYK